MTNAGYTKFLSEQLQVPFVWAMRNVTCSLSAPTAADIAYTLDRMRGWLKLAAAEIRAEFPRFEIAAPLQVFTNAGPLNRTAADWQAPFARLAAACHADVDRLISQYEIYASEVARERAASSVKAKTMRDSWLQTVERLTRPRVRDAYPDD